jgi:hypothetical protein
MAEHLVEMSPASLPEAAKERISHEFNGAHRWTVRNAFAAAPAKYESPFGGFSGDAGSINTIAIDQPTIHFRVPGSPVYQAIIDPFW